MRVGCLAKVNGRSDGRFALFTALYTSCKRHERGGKRMESAAPAAVVRSGGTCRSSGFSSYGTVRQRGA